MKNHIKILLFVFTGFLFSAGCGNKHKGEEKVPAGKLIRFSDPVEFTFEIAEDGTFDLGIEVIYFEEQIYLEKSEKMLDALPLYCMLMGDDARLVVDKKFEIPVKKDGKWIGEVQDNKIDRLVKQLVLTHQELKKGRYHFKVYANTPSEENIAGVGSVIFNFNKSGK